MTIKHCRTFTMLALLTSSSMLIAEGFEGTGVVEAVDIGRNLVTIDETILTVPKDLFWQGKPAIQQLAPGQRVGLSGPDGSPYPVIESIYIYPEPDFTPESRGER